MSCDGRTVAPILIEGLHLALGLSLIDKKKKGAYARVRECACVHCVYVGEVIHRLVIK